jgi:signal peptidase I
VKRIIGLPGDRVEMDGMSVKVNGVEIRGEELHDLGDPALNRLLEQHQAFRESADQGSYTVLWRKDGKREQLSTVVPNGQVFVLGDNRDAAHDSRHFGDTAHRRRDRGGAAGLVFRRPPGRHSPAPFGHAAGLNPAIHD